MNVSICVIFRNAEKTLPELLRSFRYLPNLKIEFIFVNNNSTDSSKELINSFGLKNYQIVDRKFNSLAGARNQALQHSKHEYVYFIDSDCSLNNNTWDELLKNLKPIDFQAWGGSQHFPHSVPFLKILDAMRMHYLGHFGSAQMQLNSQSTHVDHLSTTHVLYKKEMLLKVGAFDDRLSQSAEDLELSLRAKSFGYKFQFISTSQVNHIICDSLSGWLRKAWRNGVWQTRLVAYNFSILSTRRFWPPFVLLLLIFMAPFVFIYFSIFYLIYIATISARHFELSIKERAQLFFTFVLTHGIYFVSGVVGLMYAAHDKIRSKLNPRPTAS